MKLIRIASQDQLTGLFSNEFSEAITLPPQSKIALLNGVFAMDSKSIHIPPSSAILFTIKGLTPTTFTANIPSGYYTQTSLMQMLDEKLNFAVAYGELASNPCFVWKAMVDDNDNLTFNFNRKNPEPFSLPNNSNLSTTSNIFTSTSDGGSTSTKFYSHGFSNATYVPSCNEIAIKTFDNAGTPAASDDIPFMFGLLLEKPTQSTSLFLEAADFAFGMHSVNGGVDYIVNGIVVQSFTAAQVGSGTGGAKIRFSAGNVIFNPDTPVSKHMEALSSYIGDGYVLGLALKNNGTNIQNTVAAVNPFTSTDISNGNIEMLDLPLTHTLHIDSSLGASETPTKVTIAPDAILLDIFGFDDAPPAKTGIGAAFKPTHALTSSATPSSITVELPNLGGHIESYDGVSQKRRPIVAVVPSMKQDNGVLTYEPPFPPMIDLQNKFPIQLSKLEVRLLSSIDDSEVNLDYPGCTLSFVLDHNKPQKTTD